MSENTTPRPSDANAITRQYLDSILIEERLIGAQTASLETEIFGVPFRTPIMMPAFSHLYRYQKERNAMLDYTMAAKELGALNWVGMGDNEVIGEILDTGVRTVRVIKPYADRDKIFDQIAFSEAHGAFALGLDIDHIFGYDGEYDVVFGELMTRQTVQDLREYAEATKLPFIIKGVLSVTDALRSVECGARGILVSHHHGRMPFAIPPLMVLPAICEAVKDVEGFEVFVDCGIATGADVFKSLALGAKAVGVGRAMMPGLLADGTEGVVRCVTAMNQELKTLMGYTGCASPSEIEPSLLWKDGKPMAAR
ncbi:MAG: alpha-hydroxy-acid oxidizing protein [Oscillospiraceae bacterium]|nr:alpha-hydroxy-acid oxidizing protein [Oscillospiraceae bacterium]